MVAIYIASKSSISLSEDFKAPQNLAHRIHGTSLFPEIYHKYRWHVGKYTIPLDPKTMKHEGFKP